MRRAAKIDGNQNEIVNHLRAQGWSVQSLARIGDGCPDVLVCVNGVNCLLELKMPKEKINAMQKRWHDHWLGIVYVVHSPEEAEAVCLTAFLEASGG